MLVISFNSAKATCHSPSWHALMAALKPARFFSEKHPQLRWLVTSRPLHPSYWFDHDAPYGTSNAKLLAIHCMQHMHWWRRCGKWYRSSPFKQPTSGTLRRQQGVDFSEHQPTISRLVHGHLQEKQLCHTPLVTSCDCQWQCGNPENSTASVEQPSHTCSHVTLLTST